MELSAAVDGQHGLFVTVSSKETPIASVVRTVTMDGLTPKGSDFALPLPTASNASVAPSITAGDAVTAYLFAKADTSTGPVSYTHLDVYKRQVWDIAVQPI